MAKVWHSVCFGLTHGRYSTRYSILPSRLQEDCFYVPWRVHHSQYVHIFSHQIHSKVLDSRDFGFLHSQGLPPISAQWMRPNKTSDKFTQSIFFSNGQDIWISPDGLWSILANNVAGAIFSRFCLGTQGALHTSTLSVTCCHHVNKTDWPTNQSVGQWGAMWSRAHLSQGPRQGIPWEGAHPRSAEFMQQLTTNAWNSPAETRRTTQLSPAQVADPQNRELSKWFLF